MSKKRVMWSAVLAGVALVASACGSPSANSSSPASAASTTTAGAASGATSGSAGTASGGTGTGPPAARGNRLQWSACHGAQGPVGYQCAILRVPLNYADPAQGTIGIALDRHPAAGSAIGSLLVNPGGPGVSGVDSVPGIVSELSTAMRDRFNVVGFDPRGVDRSDPVTCGTGSQLDAELAVDPGPTTGAGFAALVAADKKFDAGCEARSGKILPYVGTINAARDLDKIRIALGQAKLDYLGFSYGTYLGAVYAKLYPNHIRAMVLDGALDPGLGQVATADTQSAALERQLDAFFVECAKGGCGWKPSGASAFQALLTQVGSHPVAVNGSTQQVNPAILLYGTAAALYSPQSWPLLGQALTDLRAGNGGPILELFDEYFMRASNGTYSNVVEAETAVDCDDGSVPSLAALRAAGPAAAKGAPFFGLLVLYSEATCSVWPVKPDPRIGSIGAAGSPPIVVVGSTGDPITPYAWAQALAGQLQHGVLLTRDGDGHTGYQFSSCIRTAVDDYLLYLKVPAKGMTCASD
jgi:pimeloyl-ACP methyl ester carboxylesterase